MPRYSRPSPKKPVEPMNKLFLTKYCTPVAVLGLLSLGLMVLTGTGCGKTSTAAVTSSAAEKAASSPCFTYWTYNNPGREWVRLAEADLNGDDTADLLIIYRQDNNKCVMVSILSFKAGFQITAPVDAPVEDQVISIFEMDGKPPREFSVSGRKGINAGSAVFRLEDDKIVQLFSSGYGDCC
jgi:hypothetical protein